MKHAKEFSEAFDLKKGDLILTNQYIYDPYFGKLDLEVETIFQEQYGAGEPTDVMVDAIIEDAMKKDAKESLRSVEERSLILQRFYLSVQENP